MGEEEHLSAAAHELQGLLHDGVGGHGDDGGVEAAAARGAVVEGLGRDALPRVRAERQLRPTGIRFAERMAEQQLRPTSLSGHGPFRAEFSGEAQARFEQVGGDDLRPGELEQPGEHEADRPLPGHQHDVAAQQRQPANGFEDGVDGFEHGAFGKGILGGNFHDAGQDERQNADVFGVAAARRLEPGGDAGAFVSFALGEGAMPAKMAVPARHVMVERHAVAGFEAAREDARPTPDTDDGPGGFVAEDARRRHGAGLDFFDVGGADAAGGDFDEQFVGADARDGDGFEAQVVHAAIDDGAHGFGNIGHAKLLT